MPKTITLRLKDEVYQKFLNAAIIDNRTISNLIETLALRELDEHFFVNKSENHKIKNWPIKRNKGLL
jgi:hypothetical protein